MKKIGLTVLATKSLFIEITGDAFLCTFLLISGGSTDIRMHGVSLRTISVKIS